MMPRMKRGIFDGSRFVARERQSRQKALTLARNGRLKKSTGAHSAQATGAGGRMAMFRIGTFFSAAVVLAGAMLATQVSHAAEAVDLAAAKKEGKVVWYTSAPISQA